MWEKKLQQNEINISKGIKKKGEKRVEKIGSGVRFTHEIYTIKTILLGRELSMCLKWFLIVEKENTIGHNSQSPDDLEKSHQSQNHTNGSGQCLWRSPAVCGSETKTIYHALG